MFKIQRLLICSHMYQFAYILLSIGHCLLERIERIQTQPKCIYHYTEVTEPGSLL